MKSHEAHQIFQVFDFRLLLLILAQIIMCAHEKHLQGKAEETNGEGEYFASSQLRLEEIALFTHAYNNRNKNKRFILA